MNIAYYISAHGFGHGIRSAAIINEFSPDTHVFIRTGLPVSFLQEEIEHPFHAFTAVFDCGCIQSDGITVDIPATISAYTRIARENKKRLASEKAFCLEYEVGIIVSDIAPFAFDVALSCHVPGIAVTNFTWLDIYRPFCGRFKAFAPYVDKIESQYAQAAAVCALYPALPMPYFKRILPVGTIGRPGRACRAELCRALGINPDKRLGLIYLGAFGLPGAAWGLLSQFDEWEFIGLYELPGAPPCYHRMEKGRFRYQDIVASVDLMITKPGYGACAECFISGLPMLYVGRADFAEYPVLEAALDKWGYGRCLAPAAFSALQWHDALRDVAHRGHAPKTFENNAAVCARIIESLASE